MKMKLLIFVFLIFLSLGFESYSQNRYVSQSILANGEIYKISLSKTGVYKLTYTDLQALGVSVRNLDINKISIYGNGGFSMPENTHEYVPDDLPELPLKIIDSDGDGIFDPEDCILFYAQGIVQWKLAPGNVFEHTSNIYSDYSYYFVKIGQSPAKSLKEEASAISPSTHSTSTYYYYDLLEADLINPTGVGRIWFKDLFDAVTSRNYVFTIPDYAENENVKLTLSLAASSTSSSYFSYIAGSGSLSSLSFAPGKGSIKTGKYAFLPTSNSFSLILNYNKNESSAKAWLDYVELNAICKLQQFSSQVSFRYPVSVGSGNITEFLFDTKGKNITIWDVTNPHDYEEILYRNTNGIAIFTLPSDSLREFVSFVGTDVYKVNTIGKVENQNLHSTPPVDFVIITHPLFLSAAEKLADFRRTHDGMRVFVATTTQIYNEFGSGKQDISAIRNYLKMLYEQYPDDYPKNVLLFGKVSYDFRNRYGSNSNFIPNYQGTAVFNPDICLSTDDYFVKLDDYEGNTNMGSMDMGLGRISASTIEQADNVIDKIKRYASMDFQESRNSNSVPNLADWRNIIAFCADDDEDGQGHFYNADAIARMVEKDNPVYNIDKIYMDAYKKVSTSQGQRYPDAGEALNQRVNNGCLMFTYMGHGGDNGWAHERILKRSDINSWTNKYNLAFFYAGSCSFGDYDKLSSTSPSEDMLFKLDGGAIGVISASRSSYGYSNEVFGKYIHKYALCVDSNGNHMTMGEVFSNAKNSCGNAEMYIFFGDPSMTLAFPGRQVVTDSINHSDFHTSSDTVKALSHVTISGHIRNVDGSLSNDFNGYVYPTVYDKAMRVVTLLNNSNSTEKNFKLQKNILYKGKVTVKNGIFKFAFLMPKDINYDYGFGKISYYANAGGLDANGYDTLIIGGINDTLVTDNEGPEIQLYLNSETFASGGIATSNPLLLALLKDENGINAAGAGIGHDIVMVLDGRENERIVLNSYYECDENSSTSGKIRYLLSDLSEGMHTLTLRAWDVFNNRAEASISFEVVDTENYLIRSVSNYPNPMRDYTCFYFEHNRPNTNIDVTLSIYTMSGTIVKTIRMKDYTSSCRVGPLRWDGCGESGNSLSGGIYVYRLRVKTEDGKVEEKSGKLAIR